MADLHHANAVTYMQRYSFIAQSFGAFAAISIGATGLMGMPLQVADYRNKKILKRYMVTPVSPAALLFAQFAINLIMAFISLASLFLLCTIFWDYRMLGNIGTFLLSFLAVMDILPLTQGIKLMKAASLNETVGNMWAPVLVLAVLIVICIVISVRFFKWE